MSIDLKTAKQELLKLKEEYETRINKIEDHIQNPQDDLNEHWEDQAISYRQNDMRTNLMGEARQSLVYVENALSRIENGTYGECEVCGEKIEEQRLKALPYATLCMEHAEKHFSVILTLLFITQPYAKYRAPAAIADNAQRFAAQASP